VRDKEKDREDRRVGGTDWKCANYSAVSSQTFTWKNGSAVSLTLESSDDSNGTVTEQNNSDG
jgi:hypothetical protein